MPMNTNIDKIFFIITTLSQLFFYDLAVFATSLGYPVRLAPKPAISAQPSLCPSGLRSVAADLAADLVDPALAALAAVAVVAVVVPAAVVAGLGFDPVVLVAVVAVVGLASDLFCPDSAVVVAVVAVVAEASPSL